MDNIPDDGSDTSERTVLSDSEDETADGLAIHLPSQSVKKDVVDSVQVNLQLANLWQFLLSSSASALKRFYPYDFIPAETVTDIARGSSYRVCKGKLRTGSQPTVAVKHIVLQPTTASADTGESRQNTLEAVLHELRVLTHKPVRDNVNVAQLVGYGAEEIEDHLTIYLVAHFAPGGNLKEYLTEQPDGPISMLDRANFCYDIASGLAGLHAAEIVQGDLKLANILVFANKRGFVAKLSDFGCSIFEESSAYIGSTIYNAPEIRQGRSAGVGRKADFYASDVFSFGLVVWEILQEGRSFIKPSVQESHVSWLNGLPNDELLLQALQTLENLPIQGTSPRRVLRAVLEGSLRDKAEERMKSRAIVDVFHSDKAFSPRITYSYVIDPSKMPSLPKWSFTRSDNLAETVPFILQTAMFAQLESEVAKAIQSSTYFDLAMCHLTGFGTSVNLDKFMDNLKEGALRGDLSCSGMYLRMHSALHAPIMSMNQPISRVEHDLGLVPKELYYSYRVREHDKFLQKAMLKAPFSLFSGAELLKSKLMFEDIDTIATSLRDSKDGAPLRVVFEDSDLEDFSYLYHLAARLGQIDIVQAFLEADFDVNSVDENRATPLVAACRGGHGEVVSLLINHGASPWKCQRNGVSPLHWLMMFEDDQVHRVLEILTRNHNSMVMDSVVVEPVEMPAHGLRLRWSPVHFAVAARNMIVTKALLDAGASMKGGSSTPLNLAVANHCPEMTKLILSYRQPSWQLTPFLHLGEVSTLKLMLLHGDQRRQSLDQTAHEVLNSAYSDINQKNNDGYTPLAEAIRVAPCDVDLSVFECLLDRGAKLDVTVDQLMYSLLARDDGKAGVILDFLIARRAVEANPQLLAAAIFHGNRAILESVLATDIDVNNSIDELPPLFTAVIFSNNAPAVEALIRRGADVNRIFDFESERKSALDMCLALPEGDGRMIDALINGGASLTAPDGTTIVHQACQIPARVNGAHVLSHLLKRHPGIQLLINTRDDEGFGPIHMACFCGNLDAVSILLEYGADVDSSETFNPIASTEHIARNPEERFVPFERGRFKLEIWKLTAEAILMKLLNKCDPRHGRSSLHIATSICNYDRVVELVERGMQPWVGDAKKVTPIGLLPKEVLEFDDQDTPSETPPSDFLEQGLKIKKYLEHHMVKQASQVKALELIHDPPVPIAPETDSPFQLESYFKGVLEEANFKPGEDDVESFAATFKLSETYMMQERWDEAEKLQDLILHKGPLDSETVSFTDVRSSLIRVLIEVNKLDEAEGLARASLVEATTKVLRGSNSTQVPLLEAVEKVLRIHIPESISHVSQRSLPWLTECITIDSCLDISSTAWDHAAALALFDMSLVMEARGGKLEAARLKEIVIEAVRTQKRSRELRTDQMIGYLIRNYCALEIWEDADRELNWYLGRLEFTEADHFPMTYCSLLHVAKAFATYGKILQSEMIYQQTHKHALRFRGQNSYYSNNSSRLLVELFESQGRYKEAGETQSQLLNTFKRAYGPYSAEIQWKKLRLANIYEKQHRMTECVILQRQARDVFESLGKEALEDLLEAKRVLCKALWKQQIFDEAELIARENLTDFETLHGTDADTTINATSDLAFVLNSQDRCEEARQLYESVLEKRERTNGEMHDLTRTAMTDLLVVYIRANMFEEGESLGRRAIDICERMYGQKSTKTINIHFFLSGVYEKAGQTEKSRDMKEQVLELEREVLPAGDQEILYTMIKLAESHFDLGDIDKAIDLQLEALNGYQQLEGDHAIHIMDTIFALACSYHEAHSLQNARLKYEEAIEMSRSILGDHDEKTIEKLAPLMALYTEIDEYELAKHLAYESMWFMEKAYSDDHSRIQEACNNVIIIVTSLEMWREGERQSKTLVASLERTHGKSHPDTMDAVKRLAECLTEQGKDKQAEPLYDRLSQYNLEHPSQQDASTS